MKNIFFKAKATFQDSHFNKQTALNHSTLPDNVATITAPTSTDILRYRYHHGVNLGSVFCLEQWLTPALYPAGVFGPELSAVKACIALHGVSQTAKIWSSHWKNALSDADLAWLVNTASCTSIRLPVGYYCLGTEFCLGTPFESVKEVYAGAWETIKYLVQRAKYWGLGVLLDLHALPGGANGELVLPNPGLRYVP
jgi:aryl-phospho-beta-D-glucosidase BglC (GH1 family)